MKRLPAGTALAVVLFLATLPCLPLLDGQLGRLASQNQKRTPEHYSLPPAVVMRALAFGYDELAADLLWVRTIAYFADQLHGDRDVRHLERYLNSIVALDEHFRAIYRYGPAMLVSGTGERTETEIWAAIRLLKRAVRRYPDEWRYAFYLGSYFMTELRRGSPAQRAAWQREGADWIHRASLLGADSPWLPNLAASIHTKQGQRDLAIRHLQELYLTTQDPQMKVQIAGKLKDLQASKSLDDARAAVAAMTSAQQAAGLTFVPPDLFGLVWLPPLEPFALRP